MPVSGAAHHDRVRCELHEPAVARLRLAQLGFLAAQPRVALAQPARQHPDAERRDHQDDDRVGDVRRRVERLGAGQKTARLAQHDRHGAGDRQQRDGDERHPVEQQAAQDQGGRQDQHGHVAEPLSRGCHQAAREEREAHGQEPRRHLRGSTAVDHQHDGQDQQLREQHRHGAGLQAEDACLVVRERGHDPCAHGAGHEANAARGPTLSRVQLPLGHQEGLKTMATRAGRLRVRVG